MSCYGHPHVQILLELHAGDTECRSGNASSKEWSLNRISRALIPLETFHLTWSTTLPAWPVGSGRAAYVR